MEALIPNSIAALPIRVSMCARRRVFLVAGRLMDKIRGVAIPFALIDRGVVQSGPLASAVVQCNPVVVFYNSARCVVYAITAVQSSD